MTDNHIDLLPLQSADIELTSTGLILRDGLPYEQWEAIGIALQRLERTIQFAIGDWLNYGDTAYGEKYAQAIEQTEHSYGTLRNYAYVAERVDLSLRSDNLGYSHYKEVAPLDPQLQEMFLDWAIGEGATVKELRRKIRRYNPRKDATDSDNGQDTHGYSIQVLHGDMFDILPTIDNSSIGLVVTDPPYNVTGWEWDKIGSHDDFVFVTDSWLKTIKPLLADEYNLFWFCSPQYMAVIEPMLVQSFGSIQSRIIWHRRNMAMGSDSKYKFIDTWEMIFHCGNKPMNWDGEWDDSRFDVQTHAVPQTNFKDTKYHPTQKPIALIETLVKYGSYPNDTVLDPFAGSGTTGEACLNVGRDCILVEREDEYIEVINERLQQ